MLEQISSLFWHILPVVITFLVPVVFVLVRHLSNKLTDKLDLHNKAAINDLVMAIVSQGVSYAEQMAKKKQQENQTINGGTKLLIATDYIVNELRKNNVLDLTAQDVARKIESYLGFHTMSLGMMPNVDGMFNKENEDEDDYNN